MPSDKPHALLMLQGFNALSEASLDQLAPFSSVRAVRAGETIFCQGEPSPYCFGVLSGEVVIQHVSKDSRFPPKVLGVIGPGGLFGESAIFEEAPRVAMATVSKDGKLAVIKGSALREWMRKQVEASQPLLLALLKTSFGRLHSTSHELAVVHGIGRLLGTDKLFLEQLAAVLDFLKGSYEGLDDLVFYQRSPYWEEFCPVMSQPDLKDLPNIPIQNEIVQKVNAAGIVQSFEPQKIQVQLRSIQLPWENRLAMSVIPLFDWDKAADPLQGLLLLASAHRAEAFQGGAKLLLTSIAYPLAETLSRHRRREDSVAQERQRQSKSPY